jgi:hypothetical protein
VKTFTIIFFVLLTCLYTTIQAQSVLVKSHKDVLKKMMKKDKAFSNILRHKKSYKIQIIYTQVDRDNNNKPNFTQYSYRLNPYQYFYCASMVKLPTCAMTLERLNKLGINGLDLNTRLSIDSANTCEPGVKKDTTSVNYPSLATYFKKMLLVSDNDAFNRAYDFLGPEYIYNRMVQLGYPNARIDQRYAGCTPMENRLTPAFKFYGNNDSVIYSQTGLVCAQQYSYPFAKKMLIGKGFYNDSSGKIGPPKDFEYSNFLPLENVEDVLISLIFPNSVPQSQRFDLTPIQYKFLQQYMSEYPEESYFKEYQDTGYYPAYKKYYFYGRSKNAVIDSNIRIFNIVGRAYGFLSDVAYIVDFKNNIEFFLSAVTYTNKDGILNNDKYEYDSVGYPFFVNLSKMIYNYERKRKREHKPDLSEFKLNYSANK